MEQYELAPKVIYPDLVYCLENYAPDRIFARLVGLMGGDTKIAEILVGKKLRVINDKKGLIFLLNDTDIYLYKKDRYWQLRFSMEYERLPNPATGIIPVLGRGIDPDDPNLPGVETSTFRGANSTDYMEITFNGKIPLKFHSWWKKPHFKYWQVDRDKLK